MINISKLFSLKFIFSPVLAPMTNMFVYFFAIVFLISIILAIASKILEKTNKNDVPKIKLFQKLFDLFLFFGITGFLLLFFRQQKVYFLSMPALWYLFFIANIIWFCFIIKWSQTKMKAIKKTIKEKEQKQKYL